jgi:FAD synthetase
MLRWARSLGDRLVIVLAHDEHNHKPNAVPAKTRLRLLREAGLADEVRIGARDGFAESLRQARPDILALGYDQRVPDRKTQAVIDEMGIRVIVLPWSPGKEEHHACQYLIA